MSSITSIRAADHCNNVSKDFSIDISSPILDGEDQDQDLGRAKPSLFKEENSKIVSKHFQGDADLSKTKPIPLPAEDIWIRAKDEMAAIEHESANTAPQTGNKNIREVARYWKEQAELMKLVLDAQRCGMVKVLTKGGEAESKPEARPKRASIAITVVTGHAEAKPKAEARPRRASVAVCNDMQEMISMLQIAQKTGHVRLLRRESTEIVETPCGRMKLGSALTK
jgi:hypothetical protein